ncbi:MAG: hypothetical protein KBF80_07665 [Flavobacteriales bacterium]|nr:hypothetical protein [Flavobacteriales bacterium]
MNVISAFRAEGFARYLPDHGMDVTVLTTTRDARTGESTWYPQGTPVEHDTWERCTVYRVPRYRSWYYRAVQVSLEVPFWSAIVSFSHCVTGSFNLHLIDVHKGYKRFLKTHLRSNKYDVVIGTAPPDEHIALGAWINKVSGTSFVADFRDLFDTRTLMATRAPAWSERLIYRLKHLYHRRWARHTAMHTTVSLPLLEKLMEFVSGTQGVEIRNGYLPEKLNRDRTAIRRDRFCITYAGRIYPWQDVLPFTRAYRSFMGRLSRAEQATVDLRMYGCQDAGQIALIKQELQGFDFRIEAKRVPESENYHRIAESAVLIVFDVGQHGGYTGKLMDYLGCHRHVLLLPTDQGVMERLIRDSNIGIGTKDIEIAATQLERWFREWRVDGRPHFEGNEPIIEQGSRQAQTARLAQAITTMLAGQRQDLNRGLD